MSGSRAPSIFVSPPCDGSDHYPRRDLDPSGDQRSVAAARDAADGKVEICVNSRVVMPELVADGVLVATPAGSTAYNLSAHGPILPLQAKMLALTSISPFRPRRWSGAILPDDVSIRFRVLEADKRPVAAVADQFEVREVCTVDVTLDRERSLTLLFDPSMRSTSGSRWSNSLTKPKFSISVAKGGTAACNTRGTLLGGGVAPREGLLPVAQR